LNPPSPPYFLPDTLDTEITTPRPTIDVDCDYCSTLAELRRKALRKKIHMSHSSGHITRNYRELQQMIMRKEMDCSKKQAKIYSVDPSPYERDYVFYCLKLGVSV